MLETLGHIGEYNNNNYNCNGQDYENGASGQAANVIQNQSQEDVDRVFNMLSENEDDEGLKDQRYPRTADNFNKRREKLETINDDASRRETSFHHVPTLMDEQVKMGAMQVVQRELKDESEIIGEDSSMMSESQAKNLPVQDSDSQAANAFDHLNFVNSSSIVVGSSPPSSAQKPNTAESRMTRTGEESVAARSARQNIFAKQIKVLPPSEIKKKKTTPAGKETERTKEIR